MTHTKSRLYLDINKDGSSFFRYQVRTHLDESVRLRMELLEWDEKACSSPERNTTCDTTHYTAMQMSWWAPNSIKTGYGLPSNVRPTTQETITFHVRSASQNRSRSVLGKYRL